MWLENAERFTSVNLYMPNGIFLICGRRARDLYVLHPPNANRISNQLL